jgi:hypothetical protein
MQGCGVLEMFSRGGAENPRSSITWTITSSPAKGLIAAHLSLDDK